MISLLRSSLSISLVGSMLSITRQTMSGQRPVRLISIKPSRARVKSVLRHSFWSILIVISTRTNKFSLLCPIPLIISTYGSLIQHIRPTFDLVSCSSLMIRWSLLNLALAVALCNYPDLNSICANIIFISTAMGICYWDENLVI